MGSEFSAENVQYFFTHPSAFGEGCEREIVGVDFAQPWKKNGRKLGISFSSRY